MYRRLMRSTLEPEVLDRIVPPLQFPRFSFPRVEIHQHHHTHTHHHYRHYDQRQVQIQTDAPQGFWKKLKRKGFDS